MWFVPIIVSDPSYKDLVWTLRQYEGKRCLWPFVAGGLLRASTVLVPLAGAMGGIYLGAPLKFGSVALAAIVILASGAWPQWLNRSQPWRQLVERRLRLYQTPSAMPAASVLVTPEDGQRTALRLMHDRLYPFSRRLGGNPPPHSPHLTCQITVMEPQAFQRSTSDDEFQDRIVRLLVAAGIDGMVGRVRIEGGRVLEHSEDNALNAAGSGSV